MEYSILTWIFLISYLLYGAFCLPVSSKDELKSWGIKNDTSDLAERTLQLKKLAIEIQNLRGVNVTTGKNESKLKPSILWDDLQMSEELYSNLKATFDEEKEKLLANKTGDKVRATAPDFALIPFAKWTQMPVKYSTGLVRSQKLKALIGKALQEIQTKSGCIKFEEVTVKPSGPFIVYLEHPTLGPGVCANSPLGKQQDGNVINVASTCQVYGTLIHETLHSLGFAHTQQRPDVEQFLTIQWSNIVYDARSNFKPWKYALKNQGDFDFGSIMMYPSDAFAIDDNRDTLTPKIDAQRNKKLMGQRDHLSEEDVNILKRVYCGSAPNPANSKGGVVSKSKPDCQDEFSISCGYFKTRGYCTSQSSFSSWVQDKCAKTCGLCGF